MSNAIKKGDTVRLTDYHKDRRPAVVRGVTPCGGAAQLEDARGGYFNWNMADLDPAIPLWAKCERCGRCWPAAYYPMGLGEIAEALKSVACPQDGCTGRPMLAKQDDGVLLEGPTT